MRREIKQHERSQGLFDAVDRRAATGEAMTHDAETRHDNWQSLSREEKFYFARLYFELLDPGKRDEVWDFCSPEDRFRILQQEHYWSAVGDRARDKSLGFIKRVDVLDRSAYFRLLTNDNHKNEAWELLPAPTANDWNSPWGSETPDDANSNGSERLSYFHGIALEDWRTRIGKHEVEEGELWGVLNNENRRKYFDLFTSFCNSHQKSCVWQLLDDKDKALLVARTPNHWTMSMLFELNELHGNKRDEAWMLLSDESKLCMLRSHTSNISDAQRDEAWVLADREAKVAAFIEGFHGLSDQQKQESWSLMSQKEKDYATTSLGLVPT